ncbi:MAG TPA: LuxR C-terminal-related transcriptional regulator [Ktedonobacterales bacterium]
MAEPDLLVTKLTIPPVRANLLPRAPLTERLDQSVAFPVALLSAGAGFGKTTLLAAWASQLPRPVAWLSLDHLDNDPLRFWSAVLAALRACIPNFGEAALARARVQQPQLIPFLTTLINDLATVGQEIVLILDDYHVIDEPSIHASLQFLIEHAPACLHLMISSRIDPPLALSRLRACGQLVELRDADLRVSEHEASGFLRQIMGAHLSAEDTHRLAQRTEGWLAGLQLAALSLPRHDDAGAWVAAFSGSQRLILDYVRDEVLAQQSPAIRRFLLRVSILPRMNAELCQEVTGNRASREMLEALERANLFVAPLDGHRQWYRLHDLFREALMAHLQATQPAFVPTLYERAAQWYDTHGLLAEAVEAALHGGAFTRAAGLIERSIDQRGFRNAYHTLCRWLGQLPEEIMQAQPTLSFWYALSTMFTSLRLTPAAWARTERFLLWAEQGFEAQGQQEQLGNAWELHAELAFFQDNLTNMLTLARQAAPLLSPQSLMFATNCLAQGWEDLLAGNLDTAWKRLLEGRRRAESLGSISGTVGALLLLAEACFARGELHEAARYCRQALAYADEYPQSLQQQLMTATGSRDPFFASWAYHNLARHAYEWNDLAAAQQMLASADVLGEDSAGVVHLLTSGGLIRVRLLHRLGATAEAERMLETWERRTHFPWARRALRTCWARLRLDMGDLSAVEQWSRARANDFEVSAHGPAQDPRYIKQEEEALLVARLALAQGQAQTVLQQLAPWKAQAEAQGRAHAVLEMLILEAEAHGASRAIPQAQSTLWQALRLAHPERYQRLFLDEGPTMAALLKSALNAIPEHDLAVYARHLLDTLEREGASMPGSQPPAPLPLAEPLTPQERRVLRLVAEGLSNQQIAMQLVISVATAKKHVSNLLGKLGAANRTQVLVRAREYDLL